MGQTKSSERTETPSKHLLTTKINSCFAKYSIEEVIYLVTYGFIHEIETNYIKHYSAIPLVLFQLIHKYNTFKYKLYTTDWVGGQGGLSFNKN